MDSILSTIKTMKLSPPILVSKVLEIINNSIQIQKNKYTEHKLLQLLKDDQNIKIFRTDNNTYITEQPELKTDESKLPYQIFISFFNSPLIRKNFNISQKALITTYPNIFYKKSTINYYPHQIQEAYNILQNHYIPYLVSIDKLHVYKTQTKRLYTTKSGIQKEYDISQRYNTRPKSKYLILLDYQEIKDIISSDKTINEKLYLIQSFITKSKIPYDYTTDALKQFIYRNK